MPYKGRSFNPAAVSVRLEYSSSLGMTLDEGDGAITISGLGQPGGKQKLPVKNRGAFDGFNDGEYIVIEFSVTVKMKNQTITDLVSSRLEDFLKQEGAFSGATSAGEVDGVFTVIVTYADKSTRTLLKCEADLSETHAFPENTRALTIRCHGGETPANV